MTNPINPGNGRGFGRVPGAGSPVIPLPASDQPYDPLHTLKLAAMDQHLGETHDWVEEMASNLGIDDHTSLNRLSPRDRVSLSHVARCSKEAARKLVRERLITPSQFFHCTSLLEKGAHVRPWLSLFRRPLHGLLRIATIHYAAVLTTRGEDVELGRPIDIKKSWLPDAMWNELEHTPGFPYADVDNAFGEHLERTSFDIRTSEAGTMVFWGFRNTIFDVSSAEVARYGVMQRIRICQALAIAGRFRIPWVDIVLYGGSMFDKQWFGRIVRAAHMMNIRMSVTQVSLPAGRLSLPEETIRRVLFESPPRSEETFAVYLKRSVEAGEVYRVWIAALKEARGDARLDRALEGRTDGRRVLQLREVIDRLMYDADEYAARDVLPHLHAIVTAKLRHEFLHLKVDEFAKSVGELKQRIADGKDVVPKIWRRQLRKPFEADIEAAAERVRELEQLIHPDYRGAAAVRLAGGDQNLVSPHDDEPITDYYRRHQAARLAEDCIADLQTDALPQMSVVPSPGSLPALTVKF